MEIVGTGIGIVVGALIAWYWGRDARKARAKNERLLQHQSETINNLKGFLLAVKGWSTVNVTQVNDRLQFIKEREEEFNQIDTSKK